MGSRAPSAPAPGRILGLYRSFGVFLKPYRGRLALAWLALGASVGMTVLKPWPLKLVLDSVLLETKRIADVIPFLEFVDSWEKQSILTALCAALVAIVLLESVFGYLQKVVFATAGQSATTDVLEHVYMHLQTLPRTFEGGARTGDVILRLTSDIKTMRDLLVNHVQKLGTYAITFAGLIVVMALMDWRLTLVGLTVIPPIYYASYRFARQIRRTASRKRRREGRVASIVQETLGLLPVVQAFAQEELERERLREQARRSLDAGIESARLGGAFTRSIKVLNTVGSALVIWVGATRVLNGSLTPGDLVVFASYMAELYVPIQNVSELAVQFMESLVSGERVQELVQTTPRIKDAPDAIRPPRLNGEIRFENVVFGYTEGRPVLDGVTFTIEPGQMVAIVGASGSGKSTIANLVLRFHDPWEGRVMVDGLDVRRLRVRALRRQVSVVLQEAILFRRTIKENIGYGKPSAAMSEIVEAAKSARAHDFVTRLPEGYDMLLDEQGGNLSGGQRQRIALARAFLRNAPILVLDEPTTGLDPTTEMELRETLEELAGGRTTLLITHSLAMVERADAVLVLEAGRIVQRGRHAELLRVDGAYRELVEARRREAARSEDRVGRTI
ncbi:MAG: ABC transporter ATP-binding protein [Bryobacteraceae bacterium]|nr:ABC transporter ATP-binding protein [Bryobacteraceae bacterium]